jgi:hypothetical protein
MKFRNAAIVSVAILALLVSTRAVWCEGEERPASEAEKAFYRRVFETMAAAVPACDPSGWDVAEKTEYEKLDVVAVGTEKEPFWISYTIAWQNNAALQAAEAAMNAERAKILAKTEGVSPEAANRLEQLAAAIAAAAKSGDWPAVRSAQEEIEAIAERIDSGSGQLDSEQEEALLCHEARDARAEITVMVNVLVESFMAPFAETDPVAGHPVFRTDGDLDPDYGWQEGVSFVFLGPGWQLNGEGEEAFMEALPRADLPHTRVQTVLVRIQAEEERARTLLEGINWKALEGLIGT